MRISWLRQRCGQPQPVGDALKPLVTCPYRRPGGQPSGGEKVSVDVADAASKERVAVDELPNFGIRGDAGLGQVRQSAQDQRAPPEIAESELADDGPNRQHRSSVE